jgi:N6-L-threonylcarbamoyladenine synthase
MAYALPRPMLHSGDNNFSFSGLKTAVLTLARQLEAQDKLAAALPDIAASTQQAIVEVLVRKSIKATLESKAKALVIAGGVGANKLLRSQMAEQAAKRKIQLFYPDISFCTDNGAMIALAGALRIEEAKREYGFAIKARWPLHTLNQRLESPATQVTQINKSIESVD